MKKVLSILILLISFNMLSITAENQENNYTDTADKQLSVELYANVASNFSIKIPKIIDVSDNTTSFEIEVKGELSSLDTIELTIPNSVVINEIYNAHSPVNCTVANEKSSFNFEDITNEYVANGTGTTTVTLTHDKLHRGSWSSNLQIDFKLVSHSIDDLNANEIGIKDVHSQMEVN